MISVKLCRLASSNSNLRTQEVLGHTEKMPTKGESFTMYGKPLDPSMGFRMVTTSVVMEIMKSDDPKVITFATMNSTYTVALVDEVEE